MNQEGVQNLEEEAMALERIVPLAVWSHKLSSSELAHVIRAESTIFGASKVATEAKTAYGIAIAHLVNYPGDNAGALEAAKEYAQESHELSAWFELVEQATKPKFEGEIVEGQELKLPFLYSFYFLKHEWNYNAAITCTSLQADSNTTVASAVGGLIGAASGIDSIPEELYDTISDVVWGAEPLPENQKQSDLWQMPNTEFLEVVDKLVEVAPEHLSEKPKIELELGSQQSRVKN